MAAPTVSRRLMMDGADDRGLQEPDLPRAQQGKHDDELGEGAQGGIEQAAGLRSEVRGQRLGGVAHHVGQRDQGGKGQREDDLRRKSQDRSHDDRGCQQQWKAAKRRFCP